MAAKTAFMSQSVSSLLLSMVSRDFYIERTHGEGRLLAQENPLLKGQEIAADIQLTFNSGHSTGKCYVYCKCS